MPSIKKCYDPEFLYSVIQACRKNGCEAYIHGPENKQFNLTFVALGYNLGDAAQAIADMGPWFRNVSMEGGPPHTPIVRRATGCTPFLGDPSGVPSPRE